MEVRNWTSTDHASHQLAKKKRKGQHSKVAASSRAKSKLCFFYENHPDGCPLRGQDCRFAHGEAELQTVEATGQECTTISASGNQESNKKQRQHSQESETVTSGTDAENKKNRDAEELENWPQICFHFQWLGNACITYIKYLGLNLKVTPLNLVWLQSIASMIS